MNVFRKTFSTIMVGLFAIGCVFSQNKNQVQTPVEIKANLMVLDSNNQLTDVKVEDIKLFENGVEQKISKLIKKESLNIGLVVDSSGSLRSQFDMILETAGLIAENLRERDAAFAVSFVASNDIKLAQDWTSNKEQLKRGINGMFIQGGASAVVDALMISAEKLLEKKDTNPRRALILISDCEDRNSFYKFEEVIKKLTENDVEVFVIGFMQELDDNRLTSGTSTRQKATKFAKTIASQTSGAAYFPEYTRKSQAEIVEAAKAIVLELRSQYVVEYVSTNSNRKDTERKLSVQITDTTNSGKRSGFVRSVIEIREEQKKK